MKLNKNIKLLIACYVALSSLVGIFSALAEANKDTTSGAIFCGLAIFCVLNYGVLVAASFWILDNKE